MRVFELSTISDDDTDLVAIDYGITVASGVGVYHSARAKSSPRSPWVAGPAASQGHRPA